MKHTIVFHTISLAKKIQKNIGFKSPLSLSYSQASALLVINFQKDISQREIATRLHLEPASVVSLIDELQRLNLVQRQPTRADRRKYKITLTEQGKEKLGQIKSQTNLLENFLRSNLSKKQAQNLLLTLDNLSDLLDRRQQAGKPLNILTRKGVTNENFGSKRSLAI